MRRLRRIVDEFSRFARLYGGQASAAARGGGRAPSITAEYQIWYVPEIKRPGKVVVTTRVGTNQQEATTIELMEFKLQ